MHSVATWGKALDSELLQGFWLGDLRVEPLKGEVTGPEGSEHLAPKAVEVLLRLARQPLTLVTREEIIHAVWGPGHGSNEALGRAVSEIRQACNDSHENPRLIQTLPRRGYRLLVAPRFDEHLAGAARRPTAPNWWHRLLRHGVIQAAAAYLIVGWLLVQVADTTFAKIGLPAWSEKFVTFTVIGGFPLLLLLAWFLEFVEGRVKHDHGNQPGGILRGLERNYLAIFIAYGMSAVGAGVYQVTVGFEDPVTPPEVTTTTSELLPIAENSIAVLPFFNNDGSDESQVFANGLFDDVITRLSRVPGLSVSARGDAATLEPNTASAQVRQRLRVAMYLEGSVETKNGLIRVIVQLIDSSNGFHILSRSFDRQRAEFFDIRDEITSLIVSSLRPALPDVTQAQTVTEGYTPDLDVYILFRRGMDDLHSPVSVNSIASALGWFDAALDVDPDYAAAHAGKCRALVNKYHELRDPESIIDAEVACARALELNPNLDVVHTALGNLRHYRGRYDDAESAYLEAIRINPLNIFAITRLADVYRLQQRPKQAEETLLDAVGIRPGDWYTYSALGYFYYRQGRYTEAARQFRAVIEIDPRNMLAYSNLGSAYMLAGDFAAAAPVYEKSIEIEPRANTFSNLALMYYYLGRYEEAVAAVGNAIELDEADYLMWMNLGDILTAAGKDREARDAFLQARELASRAALVAPNDPAMFMDRAWIQAMLGNRDEAFDLIGRSAAALPDDPYVDYVRALILHRFGQTGAALDALEIAAGKGYPTVILASEPHLLGLHDNKRFKSIISDAEK